MVGKVWTITMKNNMQGFRYIVLFTCIMVIGNMIWEVHLNYSTQINWIYQDFINFIDGLIN